MTTGPDAPSVTPPADTSPSGSEPPAPSATPPNAATPAIRRTSAIADLLLITLLFGVLSLAYWAGVYAVCGRAGFPLDDSYIHLQFARNLIHDGQMAFNAGVPSSGSTAPLYPMLLAGVYLVVRNWVAASIILGAITSLATALIAYGIVRNWTKRGDLARWAGILTVLLSPTVVQAYNGMESPVYSVFFLLGLWCWPTARLRLVGSLFWAIGMWLRPEFAILTPLIFWERLRDPARLKGSRLIHAIRDVIPHAVIWIAAGAAFVFYHHAQDDNLAPTTFAAKSMAPVAAVPLDHPRQLHPQRSRLLDLAGAGADHRVCHADRPLPAAWPRAPPGALGLPLG